MITKEKYSRSQRYLINETALSFTENYQGVNKHGNPIYDVVYVSIVSNAAIMVFDPNNGIEYGDDLQYQRWRLSGATTGLVSSDAHNIYARLNKQGSKEATIIFSVRNYNTNGSITKLDADGKPAKDDEGNTIYDLEASDTYWYILIGTLTELSDTGRTLTFDPGNLSTQYQQNEQGGGWVAEMFELVRDAENLIRAKLRFEKLEVKGESLFDSIANFYKGIKIGHSGSAKAITSVATDLSTSEDATDAAATPAYVKAFSEGRYLSKTATDPQSVAGPVTFEQDVTVEGDHAVEGNQTIGGTQEVVGLQTLHKGFQTAVFRNVAGQITGAQLTEDGLLTVAGLQAMTFEVFELIYNLIKAQSGKVTYSPTVTIESCMYALDENETELVTPDDFYNNNKGAIGSVWNNAVGSIHHVILTIKKTEDNKGLIPLVNGDFIYGYVNQIGESGQYSRGGQSIMHVITPDTEIGEGGSMVIRAMLEPVGNAAANPNYVSSNMPPTESMVLAQRGNINGTEGRTTSFFIDTEAGHIIMLQNVTTPTITDANYAIINGLLPDDLLAKVSAQYPIVDKHTPVSYARYGIFENILEFAHQGGFIQRENSRGAWDVNTANSADLTKRYKNEVNYYDTVTHDGSTWKCLLSDQPDEPGTNKTVWLQLVAKGDDGTSIKIKGEKPSYSDLPIPPADESDCYIVGQDLYVWLPEIQDWHNVGQFKGDHGDDAYVHLAYANSADGVKDFSTTDASGRTYIGSYSDNIKKGSETPSYYTWMYNKGEKGDKGDDAITLDLSNDMDSMMYAADGTKLTTEVKTTASLRVGKTVNPSGITWLAPIVSGCTATRTGSTYTVTAIEASTNDASVIIKANYGGETYERVFSIKKIVGQAKYEVLCTPNSLTYNETTSVISAAQVNVTIYKTEQDSSGTLNRGIVASLPAGYTLKINGTNVSYSAGNHKIQTSSTVDEYIVELYDNNSVLQDTEIVSLTKVKNGAGISEEIIEYGVSDDFVTEPSWDTAEPTNIEQGKVLWVKTTTKYTTKDLADNVTITKTYQGLNGAAGKGINSITVQYTVTDTADAPDITKESLWEDTYPTGIKEGQYVWTLKITDFEDTDKEDKAELSVSRVAADGTSVAVKKTLYQVSDQGTNPPIGEWQEDIPEVKADEYLWTRLEFTSYATAKERYSYSVSKSGANGKDVKIRDIDYAITKTSEQPADDEFIYEDNPPKVNEGEYLWVRTIFETADGDKKVYTYSYQGLDNTSVQYELRTNVNIIYIHDRESASKQSIRITVGKTTSKGYTEITDSDTLLEEGFIVQYNYDSRGERKTLSFANTAMLLEGDDDTLLVGEDDSEMVYEFTVEDITSIEDHIMFYLTEVDSAGNIIQDWATREVDVVRDGDGALTIDLNEDSIILTTSVDTEPYTIINDVKTYALYPTVKIGGVDTGITKDLIDSKKLTATDSYDNTLTFTSSAGKRRIVFDLSEYEKNGIISESDVPTYIDFAVNTTNSKGETITTTKRINIIRNYRGLTGKTGALYFAQGFFSEQAAKEGLYICNERNIGFVIDAEVKDSQNGGHYEYTGKPFRYRGDNGAIYPETDLDEAKKNTYEMLTPHEDYKAGGDYAWRLMPKYEVVLANFIMANNARFGHLTRGGVFYDRYLFSAYGTTKEGVNAPYDTYVEDMFDGDDANGYTLNGDFTPNLFLDFFGGAAKFGKLSESFIHVDYKTILKTINLDECHNISCAPLLSAADGSVVVVMPKATTNKWTTDGTHSTIIHEYSAEFASLPYTTDRYEAVLCVCADDALLGNASPNYNEIFGMGEDTDDNEAPHNGWFIWNGYRTKFIFLTPSSILKLRSCNTDGGGIVWFVENSSDFDILDARMALKYNNGETEVLSDQTTTLQGSYRNPVFIGSKALNQLREGNNREYPSWDWNPTLSGDTKRYLTPSDTKYDK